MHQSTKRIRTRNDLGMPSKVLNLLPPEGPVSHNIHITVRDFPFDKQKLTVALTSHFWSCAELQLRFSEGAIRGGTDLVSKSVIQDSEWIYLGTSVNIEDKHYPYMTRYENNEPYYPHVEMSLLTRRNPWYFILRVALVSVLVNILEVVSFYVSAAD